ncbi:flavin-containing monooxygenase FMO GS-OX-like 7 isoform X2 [Fopius arisanus]|uniref:Flavin-containing monooxygenase n=1 Tax=Fopius arisanus TaxID=64838 RepID=A0A9R1TAR9_9HYME|nr:PREDICTED: flavin-containing monooxygenase FMO GS-OX-like 7 isoform X2 [Fopius arisanus]
MPSNKTRVAIIGGGVAGLVAARHISSRPQDIELTLFEQTDAVGGTWVYTDDTDLDKNGLRVHSSITNLPKEIMQIPDFPLKVEDTRSFVSHRVIKQYLEDYTQHFNIYPFIKFNTLVTRVEPSTSGSGRTIYAITYEDVIDKVQCTQTFDAVVVCNGNYSVGVIPMIKGSETFPGDCIHSHQYRNPKKYAGRRVCIFGASWSGIDIATEVANYATKIYLSHNLETLGAVMPENIEQRPGIISIEGNTVIFKDGTSAEVDDLIYCTGYKFTYPFLSEKIELLTVDNHVEPIYKHLIHTDMPNLFFMGLPSLVIPFPMFHIQAQYILKILEGQLKLPSSEEMRMDFMREKQALLDEGIPVRHISKLKERQWSYYDELASAANVPSFPPVIRKIITHVDQMRAKDFTTYKNYQYKILDRENFTYTYRKIS